jgi:hypothetical protein
MYPMRFPPFLFFILIALILLGGFELLFKLALIAAMFMFFGKYFGFGRGGWGYPGRPMGRHPGHHRRHHGHPGHPGHYGHQRHPHGRHGRGHGPWGWDWDESDSQPADSERRKQKNAPQDDDTVDAEAWV